jgi:hypothetical protein
MALIHETIGANVDFPRGYANWTEEKIDEQIWKNRTGKRNRPKEVLDMVFDAICDKENWKKPIKVFHPQIPTAWLKRAIVWHHGCDAVEVSCGFVSRGYSCW